VSNRKDVANGTPGVAADMKRKWFMDHLPEGASENHLRLVFTVAGFTRKAVEIINEHNTCHSQSAIVLCQASEKAFGPCHKPLQDMCGTKAVTTSGKAQAALFLSQTLQAGGKFHGLNTQWKKWFSTQLSEKSPKKAEREHDETAADPGSISPSAATGGGGKE